MAIISSSLVGMSRTLTLESVAEITRSSPRTLLVIGPVQFIRKLEYTLGKHLKFLFE